MVNIFLFFDWGVGACAMGTMASPGLKSWVGLETKSPQEVSRLLQQ